MLQLTTFYSHGRAKMEEDCRYGNHWFIQEVLLVTLMVAEIQETSIKREMRKKIEVFHIALGDKSVCGVIACMH